MIAILKTKRTLIPLLAAILAWLSGIPLVLWNPQPFLVLGTLGGGVVGWLIFRWFVTKTGLVGALSVIGVAILSGFLRSFIEVVDFIEPIDKNIRWVAPLLLMSIGIRNILASKGIVRYVMNMWGAVSKPVFWLVLYALSSVLYSSSPLISLGRGVTFAAITIGLAAALWPTITRQTEAERLLRLIALLMALIILPGQLYIFFPNSIAWHGSNRFHSTFRNPVTFSHLCASLLPLYWWIGVNKKRVTKGWRTASQAMVAILILNIYLTKARSGALALFVIVFLLSWSFVRQKNRVFINYILIIILTFSVILQPQTINNYFTRGASTDDISKLTSNRYGQWELAVASWSSSPVFGTGFGTIDNTSRDSSDLQSQTVGLRLSNLYFEILASGGLIGAGLMLHLLFKCLIMFRYAVENATEEKRFMMSMAFATFACGLVLNLSETWLISAGSPFAMYWWLVLFLASRVATLEEPEPQQELCVHK